MSNSAQKFPSKKRRFENRSYLILEGSGTHLAKGKLEAMRLAVIVHLDRDQGNRDRGLRGRHDDKQTTTKNAKQYLFSKFWSVVDVLSNYSATFGAN